MESGAAAAAFVAKEVTRLWKEWSEKNRRANILIAGKTGVGKSTLINTVFRENLAKTGNGRPVTQKIEEISKAGVPITILDTKGLELADFEVIRNDIISEIEARRGENAETYVHVAWLCISEGSARIEDAEIELAIALKAIGIKVMIIVTKVSRFKDNSFEKVVREQFSGITADVVLTRALSEDVYDDDDRITGHLEVRGIDQLLDLTNTYLPESQRHAFANATSLKHKKALELKRGEAKSVITFFSGAAATVGATPIPFSDAIALVPMQIGMIIKISQVYGMNVSREAALPVLASLTGISGTSMLGRTIVSGLLKMIPGAGSFVGGAISATTAATLTSALGNLYASTLSEISERGEELQLTSALNALKRKIKPQ